VSVDTGNLVLLKPAGRTLARRVEGALQWPLLNGKLHYVDTIRQVTIDRLKMEMEKFPYFHSDILNIMAYLYDMTKEFTFNDGYKTVKIDYSKYQFGII
jgi:hypothetical protein